METGRFISVDAANGIQMSKSQKKMKYESIKKKKMSIENNLIVEQLNLVKICKRNSSLKKLA